MSDQMISVGHFLGPHGIKGWVKIYSYTDPKENIATYTPLWLKRDGIWQPIELAAVQTQGKGLVAKLPGCDDRDTAATYRGLELAIKPEQLPELEQGEYYWSQLKGLIVVNAAQQVLGVVTDLMETGANDVLVVSPTEKSVDQEQRLIPYLPDNVVIEVDLEGSRLIVDWGIDY